MNNNEFNKFARMHQCRLSSLPYDKVAADGERDFWMTAQEALEYGMVDQILTKK